MCDKKISIVGAGMGTAEQLTGLGSRRLREAQVVVGAPRLTEGLSGSSPAMRFWPPTAPVRSWNF